MATVKEPEPGGSAKGVKIALILNSAFVMVELAGGLLTNSMAILSDALHDLGDSLSLGLAWYFQKLSGRTKDGSFSFGYRRFSLAGAVINSMILLVGSIFILQESIPRLFNPKSAEPRGMFLLALLGVGVNGAAAFRLRRGKTLNEQVASLHLWEDVLGWLAVLIGSAVMIMTPLPVIDPLLSIAITLFILFNVVKNLKKSLRVFLQGVPAGIRIEDIKRVVESFPGVTGIHDIHIWSMDGQYNILTLHLIADQVNDYGTIRDLKSRIKEKLIKLNIDHITIEIDGPEEVCYLDNCR